MYYYGPIKEIELYRSDVVVVRSGVAPQVEDATRAEITEFSSPSRKRLAFVAANTEVDFTTMYTLTYPSEYPSDGEKVRRDRRAFLDWLRRDQHSPEYLWFLEFQKRGAPHLHILTDQLWPRQRADVQALRFRVSSTWYRIVGSGDTKHLVAGTRTEKLRSSRGGSFYAVKYAMKMQQKRVPENYQNVGRFWGNSKGVKPAPRARLDCTERELRGILAGWEYAPKENCHVYRVCYNAREVIDAFVEAALDGDE